MIVRGVRLLFVCLLFVTLFVPPWFLWTAEDMKIWKEKKSCVSMCRCATEKKISKRVDISAFGDFFSANKQWTISVKALLYRGLLLAQR